MKKIITTVGTFFLYARLFAQITGITNASAIPDSLKANAHSVKRSEQIVFDVKDIDEAKLTVYEVITALDAEGEKALNFFETSNSFRKLQAIDIVVYDAAGTIINKYKLKDLHVTASGQGLVEDGKDYFLKISAPSFPLTVQYQYEIKYKGTLNYPDYYIQEPEQSVQYSSYTASIPEDLKLRFKAKNISISPAITVPEKNQIYFWEVKNLRAIPYERGATKDAGNYPQVMIAPNKFSMDGNVGDLSSWKNFGSWYSQLLIGTDNLPEWTKNTLKKMVEGVSGDKEKIKIIYNYLQKNFRYVSIQLGIGGYKPFPASFVDEKKYGDCKALSNYLQACLHAIGIKSYQALINARYNVQQVDPSFPHNAFNHDILCVPQTNGDTIWLECTSSTNDFNVLGSFTENKNALLVTPDGGIIVKTPASVPQENTLTLSTKVQLNEDGSGIAEGILTTSGECKQQLLGYLLNEKEDMQKAYFTNYLGFMHPDELELATDHIQDSAKASFNFSVQKIPDFMTGSKMFLNPHISKPWNIQMPMDKERRQDFYFEYPFIKIDSTIYQLPGDYTVAELPAPTKDTFEFGSFETNYSYDTKSNTITTCAMLCLSRNLIPAKDFMKTYDFFSHAMGEFAAKIVIKKN
jgi:Domain of Unknown Function with PDB structure (DUF3857)/Transglutaminase-like superfamily